MAALCAGRRPARPGARGVRHHGLRRRRGAHGRRRRAPRRPAGAALARGHRGGARADPAGPVHRQPARRDRRQRPGRRAPVYDVVCREPSVGMLVEPYVLPWPTDQEANRWHREALERVVDAGAARDLPLLVVSVFEQQLSDWAAEFGAHPRVGLTRRPRATMAALGKLFAAHGTALPEAARPPQRRRAAPARRCWARPRAGRSCATPASAVPRGQLARDRGRGRRRGRDRSPRRWWSSSALPGVGHKGRVGGVAGRRRGRGRPCATRVPGRGRRGDRRGAGRGRRPVLVCEMVFGPELLVGAIRDPVAGPTLTVGVRRLGRRVRPVLRHRGRCRSPAAGRRADRALGPPAAARRRPRAAALGGLLSIASPTRSPPARSTAYGTVELNPVILTGEAAVAADVLLVR